jgi:hypothetical protein
VGAGKAGLYRSIWPTAPTRPLLSKASARRVAAAVLQSLRKRLENGDLGDLYQVATRRQGPFPARIADVGVVAETISS